MSYGRIGAGGDSPAVTAPLVGKRALKEEKFVKKIALVLALGLLASPAFAWGVNNSPGAKDQKNIDKAYAQEQKALDKGNTKKAAQFQAQINEILSHCPTCTSR